MDTLFPVLLFNRLPLTTMVMLLISFVELHRHLIMHHHANFSGFLFFWIPSFHPYFKQWREPPAILPCCNGRETVSHRWNRSFLVSLGPGILESRLSIKNREFSLKRWIGKGTKKKDTKKEDRQEISYGEKSNPFNGHLLSLALLLVMHYWANYRCLQDEKSGSEKSFLNEFW